MFCSQYEPYYAGAAAAGAPQYLYATGSSQSNTNGGGNSSGSGNNGTGATSPPTAGPPPPLPSLPPPPPTHFYAPAAPPPHHHPPVPAGPPPPPAQVDHLYYSFAAGPPPPPPPHASMGLTEQQLLLYATDASCQQTTTSDGQAVTQEVSPSFPFLSMSLYLLRCMYAFNVAILRSCLKCRPFYRDKIKLDFLHCFEISRAWFDYIYRYQIVQPPLSICNDNGCVSNHCQVANCRYVRNEDLFGSKRGERRRTTIKRNEADCKIVTGPADLHCDKKCHLSVLGSLSRYRC